MNASHLDLQLTRHYLGSAKVRLDQLQYDPGTDPSARLADPHRREANVARLLDIFQNEGWRPLDPKNHISAVVPRSRLPLSAPLARSPYGPDFPDVDLETVPYVDGRDRVAAARFFPVDKQWWIVDFYDSRPLAPAIADGLLTERLQGSPSLPRITSGSIIQTQTIIRTGKHSRSYTTTPYTTNSTQMERFGRSGRTGCQVTS